MAFILISFWWDILICTILVGVYVYVWFQRKYSFWKNKGIYNPTPSVPFGNFQYTSFGEWFKSLYFKTKQHPFAGIYIIQRPTLIINDLDLLKAIMVKDFVHFSDHGIVYDEESDPITGNLFNATGEKWKNLRNKLTPTFTSSKMRKMFDIVADCSEEMKQHLSGTLAQSDGVVDVKDLFENFNMDVIGNCAFGIECNSFKNPDSEFRKMGKRSFSPTVLEIIVLTFDFFFPNVITKYRTKILGTEVNDFFINLVTEMVKYREENAIERNDFLQLLIQLMHQSSIDEKTGDEVPPDDGTRLTLLQVAAQVFVFFVAGFETSSTTAGFALYEMALNPEIQDTVKKEIDEVVTKNGGKVTYDALQEMSYLNKVIQETLRKYPPFPVLLRICTKEYTLPGTEIVIEKDTPVLVSTWGIHMDPDYYPEPSKFDPERFTPENTNSRHHFSYLPFGEGPRLCIGNRFAVMQIRLGLVSILSKYEVSVCEKTSIPMKLERSSFILSPKGGLHLQLKKRNI